MMQAITALMQQEHQQAQPGDIQFDKLAFVSFLGTAAGAAYGATRKHKDHNQQMENIGRGTIRGMGAGAGADLGMIGGGLVGGLAGPVSGNPMLGAVGGIAGALAGGAGGGMLGYNYARGLTPDGGQSDTHAQQRLARLAERRNP